MNEELTNVAVEGTEKTVEAVTKGGKGTGILIGVATAIGVVAAVKGIKKLVKKFGEKKKAEESAPKKAE